MLKRVSELKKRLNQVDEDKLNKMDLEKGDIRAMVIAALITLVPPILIGCALIYGVLWFIFLR